ncbi:MAG: hypothetical protein LBC99_08065 [Spirochaetota bacterium]|nr:hypothetical protein [Spirochaetota bacterium]
MKKYLVITLAVLAALACVSCEAADDDDFDPDYEGSIISFTVTSNVSGVAPMSFSWGQNTSSKATQVGNTLTLQARKNNRDDSPKISIVINGLNTNAWVNTWPGCTMTIDIPDGDSTVGYTGTANVVITQRGGIMGEKTVGTFTGSVTHGDETLTVAAGKINLKYFEK